jgi:two-component sensor histidine kinase
MSITELKEEEESLLKSIEAKKKRIQELQHKQQTLVQLSLSIICILIAFVDKGGK